MNMPETSLPAASVRRSPVPGAALPVAGMAPRQEVREIGIEMVPVQRKLQLENFADNFGEGWLDRQTGELRLQFQLVTVFDHAQTAGIWLSVPGVDEKIALPHTRVQSPGVGQRHSHLPWSGQSRFVVDTSLQLPEWARDAGRLEILGEYEGETKAIGVIHVGREVGGMAPRAEPPAEAGRTMHGSKLSIAAMPVERQVHEISVEILPLGQEGLIACFADHFGAGWLDRKKRQLRLQFHVIPVFGEGPTDGLSIALPGRSARIRLSPERVESPVMGQRFSHLPWAAQCRFAIDEVLDLPDWAARADMLELLAEAAGRAERIGTIHVGQPYRMLNEGGLPLPVAPRTPQTIIRELAAKAAERIRRMNRVFLNAVALPTLLASVYFGLIASDVYISESKFIIRSPDKQSLSPLGMILKGADFGRAQDDSYSVQEFILSRDALRKLDERMAVGKAFASNSVDVFSRFAGLDWDKSFEALFKYYQRKVDVQIDSASSIITLTTRGFTAEQSQRANQLLLEMSEALVNQLNENGRQDMIRFAQREVADAEARDKEATLALARLQTGGGGRGGALVGKFAEYQRLTLEKEYADKLLATAMSSLEEARNQAVRKQLYLERIEQPGMPDRAMEPRRLRSVLAVFVLGLVVWGVLTMLIAGIREHQD